MRGRIGENCSYAKSFSGRVLIDAAKQAETPQPAEGGVRWEVITKGTPDGFNGVYTLAAAEPFEVRITGGSPARIVAPDKIEMAARPGQTAQLHLLFPGRADLPAGIRLIRPGYTAEDADRQVFTTEYIALLARLNTGVVRSMDWQRTNGSEIVGWDTRGKVTDALWGVKGRGGPIEPVVTLCNTIDADLWFCVPHKADDDYCYRAARLVRDTLAPASRAYVEYSNEAWNNAPGFPQTEYCRAMGDADPAAWAAWPDPGQRTQRGRWWYAKRSSEVAAIFAEAFRGERYRLVTMLAGQTGDSSVLRDALAYGWRPDALATGGYFNAPRGATVDEIFAGFAASARAVYSGTQHQKFHATADAAGCRKLIYEWTGAIDSTDLAEAVNADPRIAEVYAAAGEGLDRFEVAAHFVPVADKGSKYAATTEVGTWTAKCAALADLSAARPHPHATDPKDQRIAELAAERDALRARITAARQALEQP